MTLFYLDSCVDVRVLVGDLKGGFQSWDNGTMKGACALWPALAFKPVMKISDCWSSFANVHLNQDVLRFFLVPSLFYILLKLAPLTYLGAHLEPLLLSDTL